MRRVAALFVGLLAVSACGDGSPIPAEYLMVRVETATPEVTLGAGFPVTVVRVFSKDLEPSEFTEADLEPLRVRLLETNRRENDTHVEETLEFLAYAMTAGDVSVPPPLLVGTPVLGGAKLAVEGNRLELTVKGTIDPAAPGDAELPGDAIAPTRTFGLLLLLSLGGIAVLFLVRRRHRSVPVVAPAELPAPPPLEDLALAELKRLRGKEPETNAETQALYLEVSGVLRGYLGRRFSIDTVKRTSEELTALAPLTAHRRSLQAVLGPCDLVKFAKHAPTAAERGPLFDAAEQLVRETSAS